MGYTKGSSSCDGDCCRHRPPIGRIMDISTTRVSSFIGMLCACVCVCVFVKEHNSRESTLNTLSSH